MFFIDSLLNEGTSKDGFLSGKIEAILHPFITFTSFRFQN